MAQITLNSSGVASSGSLLLQTNGTTTQATVDTSGNLGLGVTPSAWAGNTRAIDLQFYAGVSSGDDGARAYTAVTNNVYEAVAGTPRYKTSTSTVPATMYRQRDGQHQWFYAAAGTAGNAITFTQAMTLDSSGNLSVGRTSGGGRVNIQANSNDFMNEFFNQSGTSVGSIQTNGTTTSYVTSSDYRLKENIQPMTGALEKVAALKPVTYTWKATGASDEGFIAHELQEICASAVTGEKDAVDENGNPKYQGIDTSFLVATLTAALQEAHGLIKDLQTRVAALES